MNPSYPQRYTGLGKVTTPYGGKTAYESFHPGVDIANKKGTPIKAFADGVVLAVKDGQKNGDNGFGNSIITKDAQGNIHRYSHLYKPFLKPGQKVQRGQPIGAMGDSGSSYSPSGGDSSHLDYRIVDAYGKYKNPTPIVNSLK